MESIQTNALNSKYINSLLRPEENPFMQEMQSFEEIMMMYSCAIREVKTKFEVLNDDFSVRYKRNPIEFIQSRIKKPVSIAKKLASKGCPVTCASILNNLDDVAGIRVICPFIDDIYMVAEKLISQDDITLIEAKDYISHPKAKWLPQSACHSRDSCVLRRPHKEYACGGTDQNNRDGLLGEPRSPAQI